MSQALQILQSTSAVQSARELADSYGQAAIAGIAHLPDTEAKAALISVVRKILNRKS